MIDILLLCRMASGAAPAILQSRVRTLIDTPGGVVAEAAMRLPDDALPTLAHAAGADAALPDLILTLQADDEAVLADASRRAISALSPGIIPADTTLLATHRHAILPGDDAIRLFFGLRRLDRLSLSAFHDYWLNRHAALGRRFIPPYSYHQLHADPAQSARIASATGLESATFDGVVEVHFPDIAALVAQLSRPEVAQEALADERNFIDHARSIFWAYRTF